MSGVHREPVSHASRTVVFRGAECVVVEEDVWLCMCGGVCLVVYVWFLIIMIRIIIISLFTQKTNSIMRYTKLRQMFATTCDVHKPPKYTTQEDQLND